MVFTVMTALYAPAFAAAPPSGAVPANQAAQGAPVGYVLMGMPLVVQSYNACGPASITQVLNYFGVPVKMKEVSLATRPTERSYMTAQAILDYVPSQGLEAKLYRGGSVQALRAAVTMRLPLIVLQNQKLDGKTFPHWRVAVGFDDARREVYVLDPLLGSLKMPYQRFEEAWASHDGLFAVVYPPQWRQAVVSRFG